MMVDMSEAVALGTSPEREEYDCIVVGSGLGGLSAGAFLAKSGKNVLVLERLDGPGGYAHAFKRDAYTFDPAVHAIGQAREGLMLDTWLRALDVRDECNLIDLDPFYSVFLPDYRFDAPFGVEEFVEAHVREFPHEEKGFREFIDLCRRIKNEWDQARPGTSLEDLANAGNFQTVLEHRTATVGEVIDRYVQDQRLKTVVTALWGYQGVPPSMLSFITYGGMMISLLEGGQVYCAGSFQNLVNCFVKAIVRNNGEVVVKNQVGKILVDGGRVRGVVLADGREVRAPVVVSNADMKQTIEQLVGEEHFPEAFLRRTGRMTTATSAFVVYAASTLDFTQFRVAHEAFVYTSWDLDETWRRVQAGELAAMAITVPTLEDPSLAPEGEHSVVGVALMPFDVGRPWPELKEEYTQRFLDQIEAIFPGFRAGLTFAEGATPQALYGYSLNQNGAMYGWENNTHQVHSRRPANRSPVEGLYFAGAWAQPGSGTVNAMASGFQTALMIDGQTDPDAFLDSLGSTAPAAASGT
jgi:phytoene desaturase